MSKSFGRETMVSEKVPSKFQITIMIISCEKTLWRRRCHSFTTAPTLFSPMSFVARSFHREMTIRTHNFSNLQRLRWTRANANKLSAICIDVTFWARNWTEWSFGHCLCIPSQLGTSYSIPIWFWETLCIE